MMVVGGGEDSERGGRYTFQLRHISTISVAHLAHEEEGARRHGPYPTLGISLLKLFDMMLFQNTCNLQHSK